jgi:Predicted integral membrane protein
MKSSTALKLTLMTGAAATLTLCSETQQTFSSVSDCIQAGNAESLCRQAYETALSEHMKTAPTFASEEECRAKLDIDRCVSVPKPGDGTLGNVIMPMMAGYMIGQRQRENEENQGSASGSGGSYHGSGFGMPLYRSRKSPDGYWTSTELKTSMLPSHQPNVKTTTISRHGFGGHAFFGGG